MYTFRFNPVFQQWVLLGEPIPSTLTIQSAHRILPQLKAAPNFQAATYPRQPFVLDPLAHTSHPDDLLYAPQPPVGEYELILYTGERSFFNWTPKDWEAWFQILAERFRNIHLNPHLHFVSVSLSTRALRTAGDEYQRVGDVIATSHPIAGDAVSLSTDLVKKLLDRERLFVVAHDHHGALYVPTAPLHHHEVWYLPATESQIDGLLEPERTSLARSLSHVFHVLHEEFPEEQWQLKLHTPMAGTDQHGWWVQIYQETLVDNPLPMQPLPERFTFLLHQLLSHHAAK